jgi:hypothetical protein
MSLIFDSFKTEQDARRFIDRVQQARPGRECQLFLSNEEAQKHDVFPWVQIPPIVHVDRTGEGVADEEEIEALVDEFPMAVFAGT